MTVRILHGDCRDTLKTLADESVHCCVTSPPYFGLRDYGNAAQIGLEATPDEFIAKLVAVFRDVRRVLREDGTLWVNMGDSYAANRPYQVSQSKHQSHDYGKSNAQRVPEGLKAKDLIGVPWMLAFALRADGWYLRQDIIWAKPNPMPESVRDRCTKAHEYLFLLAKSPRYHCDMEAIKEDAVWTRENNPEWATQRAETNAKKGAGNRNAASDGFTKWDSSQGRNKRSVWTVSTAPFSEAHFATFPPALIEPCILAGCPEGGTVLDPFGGAGTTGLVADRFQRSAILCELNPEYIGIAERRITGDAPLFTEVAAA